MLTTLITKEKNTKEKIYIHEVLFFPQQKKHLWNYFVIMYNRNRKVEVNTVSFFNFKKSCLPKCSDNSPAQT